MKWFAALRDTMKKFYADYDFILKPVFRFLFCLLCLLLLKNTIGVNEAVCRPLVLLGLAAVSALFPWGFISLECTAFILANMYRTSLALFLIGTALFLFTVLLYFGFRPGKGILIILIPIGFLLKIPYVMPVILGLSSGVSAIVPVSIGVVVWKIIEYFALHCESMVYTTNVDLIIEDFVKILTDVFGDRTLYLTLIAFAACMIAVYLISRMSISHSWTISVIIGSVLVTAIQIAGCYILGTEPDLLQEVIRLITALMITLVYEFLFYAVDYKATEHLQFEDDDYYYYVKAVPKVHSESQTQRRE